MRLQLKNKAHQKKIFVFYLIVNILYIIFFSFYNWSYNTLDRKANDVFYKFSIEHGEGPIVDNRIKYVNISNETYEVFGNNSLDRIFLSRVNNVLTDLAPYFVIYDILFPYPSTHIADSLFTKSLTSSKNIYLPVGFRLNEDHEYKFEWGNGSFYNLLRNKFLGKLKSTSYGKPFSTKSVMTQYEPFMQNSANSGHINSKADIDGVFRHYPLVLQVDSLLFPTITLSAFLDYQNIPFDSLEIDWGNYLKIPALSTSFLDEEIRIPINEKGEVFIPYPNSWSKSHQMIEAHNLIKNYEIDSYYDELIDFFEGSFVFIADISTGISDLGQTTIEENVPLVAIHAALLNGYLQNSFYSRISIFLIIILPFLLNTLTSLTSLLKKNIFFFLSLVFSIIVIIMYSYIEITNFRLVPVITILINILLFFFSLLIYNHSVSSKHEAFIKDAFSRYLSPQVMEDILANPSSLQLGGVEKNISVLFSDIANFTTLSEKVHPNRLVKFMNEYLTAMSDIIINNKGIIDKFLGDGIMAEFGAPIFFSNHAEKAIDAGILMQKKIIDLNKRDIFPDISIRIGINSGSVIVGNIGSNQVFDFTVLGDNVNLAARLEGVNKFYGTGIIISQNTFNLIDQSKYLYRPLDFITVKGKTAPILVYEIIGFNDDSIEKDKLIYTQLYKSGFEFILENDFNHANKQFNKALELFPNDKALKEILSRISDKNNTFLQRTMTEK